MRNELLIELLAALILQIVAILLLFPDVLEWTLIIPALADVDELVARRLGHLHLDRLVLRHF